MSVFFCSHQEVNEVPTTRRFIAIQAMMLEPHARSYDSGEDGIFPECRSCRFHRPYALRQTCVFRPVSYTHLTLPTILRV